MSKERLICEWCSKEFERPAPKGPSPRFCSPAHRQAAHQARQRELAAGMKEAMASTQIAATLASSMPKFDTGIAAALASSMPKFDTGIAAVIADMASIPKFDTGIAAALADMVVMPRIDPALLTVLEDIASMPSTLAQLEQLQTATGISEDLERLANAYDGQGLDRNSSTSSAWAALLLLILLAVVLQVLGQRSVGEVKDIARTASQDFLLLDGIYQSLYGHVAAIRAVMDLLAVIGGIQLASRLVTGGSRSEPDDEGGL